MSATAPVTVFVTVFFVCFLAVFFVVLVVPELVEPALEPVDAVPAELGEPLEVVPDTMASCEVVPVVPEVDV